MSPNELAENIKEAGIFCLPSYKEAWGVVIHEYAAAGLPLITSDRCGASTAFLRNGYNGYTFRTGDLGELKKVLLLMMNKTSSELLEMGQRSNELSKQITEKIWAETLNTIIKKME